VSNKSKAVLRKSGKASFDPKNFLAKVGGGKTILKCEKDEIVFLQGDVSDAIFYIQKGKIKLTVVSERGKEVVVGLLELVTFSGKVVSRSSSAYHNSYRN
jgi:CRP/FNR family transcriptional regulator, cyclic AMP receptor protein